MKNDFERSGRGQEPSRGHKFSIFENLVSIWDFTSSMHLHFRRSCWGVPAPNPAHGSHLTVRTATACRALYNFTESYRTDRRYTTKTNVQSTPSTSQHHDTPNNKTHVIKFRDRQRRKNVTGTHLQTPESLPLHFHPPRHPQRQIEKNSHRCRRRRRNPDHCFHLCLPSAARWAPTSTSLQGTSIPAVRTPSRYERKFLTNLQT